MSSRRIQEAEFGPSAYKQTVGKVDPESLDEPSKEQLDLVGLTPDSFAALDPGMKVRTRAKISDKIAARRATDPERGHKVFRPHDYSGPEPDKQVIPGQMAPKLAGERAKALEVVGRVLGFIDKYSKRAVDVFPGYSGKPPPASEPVLPPGRKLVPGMGMNKSLSVPDPLQTHTPNKGGEGRGQLQQLMSKEKAKELVMKLPMLSTEEIGPAVQTLGNYIWRIHKTKRKDIRDWVVQRMAARGNTVLRKHFNPETGEEEERPYYDFSKDPKTGEKVQGAMRMDKDIDRDDPRFRAAMAVASKKFDTDSVQVKADLSLLAASAGSLKRSGGWGGEADKEFLDKVQKGWRAPVEIVPKEPQAKLPPELAALAGDYPRAVPKSQKGKVRAKGPTIHKAERPFEPSGKELPSELPPEWIKDNFERYLGLVIEIAAADVRPQWWQDI